MARRLRILLMAEHLGLCDEDMLFQRAFPNSQNSSMESQTHSSLTEGVS
jgi:hypothetical protein